jgi:hypothetical protein
MDIKHKEQKGLTTASTRQIEVGALALGSVSKVSTSLFLGLVMPSVGPDHHCPAIETSQPQPLASLDKPVSGPKEKEMKWQVQINKMKIES